jgi:hypothetical protein
LGVDVELCNSFRLVPRFFDDEALFKTFVCFDFSFFKS